MNWLDDQHDACIILQMAIISDNSFWQQVSDKLQEEIPPARFDAWIRALSATYNDNKLTIKVPSRFVIDGLKSSYGQRITDIATNLAGHPVTIAYEVDVSLAHQSIENSKKESAVSPASLVDGFIDPRFTFDNFVVGSGNEFCHAASRAVADNPGEIYNPLYLYGGVGLGKTHLINAVANSLINRGITKIAYRTGERFTNELIQSIRNGTSEQFRNQYRQVDVLIIDDIQFIAGKEKTQEEFFHTFNALYEVKKQIILTSDRSPRELTNLMERLRSRFNWGLVADIQAPDLETRLAILSSKAELAGITLDKDVGHLLAARITNNVRELEGALTRLTAHSTLTGRIIDLPFARHVLRDLLHEEVRSINIEDIQKKVASYFNINIREMSSSKRSKNIAYPRQVAMYATKELTTMSLPEIGRNFGGRDHTTVLHAVRKIKKMRDESDDFNEEMNRIINLLKQ